MPIPDSARQTSWPCFSVSDIHSCSSRMVKLNVWPATAHLDLVVPCRLCEDHGGWQIFDPEPPILRPRLRISHLVKGHQFSDVPICLFRAESIDSRALRTF